MKLANQKENATLIKTLSMAILAFAISFNAMAQVNVSGVVSEASGFGLPGVSVVVQGTTIGVLTGIDGDYTISVPSSSSVLEFSFIGYQTQSVTVGNQSTINVVLSEDVQMLDEVVVVGYGTQAKKDITGSVSVVDAGMLSESSTATVAEALQGKSAGVYVSTTGAPGSASTIRVRGIGSVNGSDPLVIIDGVSGGRMNDVNANDIESFQVLKDASATAIYGAQGANGVIIITTKQGTKTGTARVSYNGYVGVSTMSNKGFDMLNAQELMEFEAQGMINYHNERNLSLTPTLLKHTQFGELQNYTVDADGKWVVEDMSTALTMPFTTVEAGKSYEDVLDGFGWTGERTEEAALKLLQDNYQSGGAKSYALSSYYYYKLIEGASEERARQGTDWYDLILQNGLIMDHQISIIGGGDKGQYSASLSYTGQEGTVKSSFYNRYGIRLNSSFNPRDYITLAINSNMTYTEYEGDRGGNSEYGLFAKTYQIKSWVAPYNVSGKYAGTLNGGGRGVGVPLALAELAKGDWNRSINTQNSFSIEVKPIPQLTIKSQAAAIINGGWSRTFAEITTDWDSEPTTRNSLTENASWNANFQFTNTATYTQKWGKHNATIVVGTEALNQGFGRTIEASRKDYTFADDPNTWILNNGNSADPTNAGTQGSHTTMFGYFGRADYNYDGKYLATITVRRDASSKFSEKYRWGTFPSVSLGWRISDESFMDGTNEWLDDLKFRAGYGTTGNSNINAYNWASQYASASTGWGASPYYYDLNGTNNSAETGYAMASLGDDNARWETVKMFNVGFDATLFSNRLTLGFDWYSKVTADMLVSANFSAQSGGATKPKINIGDMKNTGVDASIGWRDRVGKFDYSLTLNLSHYENEVVRLGSSDIYVTGRQGRSAITTEGQPISMFYGYTVEGIYKSKEEVLNYKNELGASVLPYSIKAAEQLGDGSSFVGRYKIKDINNDGLIDSNDETIIGNPHPDFTGGLNLTLGYGNWDMSAYLYFSLGNDIYKSYMYFSHFGGLNSSYSVDRRDNSWSPTNPDGIYPLWATNAGESPETIESSTMYIEDGSYARMQTFQVGYTLPNKVLNKIGLSKLRLYGQVSNLFTITNYSGLDPELNTGGSGGDQGRGVDYGGYGIPRQFIFGVNLTF